MATFYSAGHVLKQHSVQCKNISFACSACYKSLARYAAASLWARKSAESKGQNEKWQTKGGESASVNSGSGGTAAERDGNN